MVALTDQQQRELDRAIVEWRGRPAPLRGYPKARARIGSTAVPRAPVIAPQPPAPPAAGVVPVPGSGVTVVVGNQSSINSVTSAVSQRLPSPFVIRRAALWTDNTAATLDVLKVVIASDDGVALGLATPGINFASFNRLPASPFAVTAYTIRKTGAVYEAFPNFLVPLSGQYIKAFHGGGVSYWYQWSFDLEFQ